MFWGDLLGKLKQFFGRGSKTDCLKEKKGVRCKILSRNAGSEHVLKQNVNYSGVTSHFNTVLSGQLRVSLA